MSNAASASTTGAQSDPKVEWGGTGDAARSSLTLLDSSMMKAMAETADVVAAAAAASSSAASVHVHAVSSMSACVPPLRQLAAQQIVRVYLECEDDDDDGEACGKWGARVSEALPLAAQEHVVAALPYRLRMEMAASVQRVAVEKAAADTAAEAAGGAELSVVSAAVGAAVAASSAAASSSGAATSTAAPVRTPPARFVPPLCAKEAFSAAALVRANKIVEDRLRVLFARAPSCAEVQHADASVLVDALPANGDAPPACLSLATRPWTAEEQTWPALLARADRGACAAKLDEFVGVFDKLTNGVLRFMTWSNVVVAGGMVVNALCATRNDDGTSTAGFGSGDIDLFLHGLDEQQALDKIRAIHNAVLEACPAVDMPIVRTAHAVTFVLPRPYPQVQIVLRLYRSVSEVLLGFDVDCCSVAYNGERVLAIPRAIRALQTRSNIVDLSRLSPSFEMRMAKYSSRGFRIVIPGFNRDLVDPDAVVGPQEARVGLSAKERKQTGLARLLQLCSRTRWYPRRGPEMVFDDAAEVANWYMTPTIPSADRPGGVADALRKAYTSAAVARWNRHKEALSRASAAAASSSSNTPVPNGPSGGRGGFGQWGRGGGAMAWRGGRGRGRGRSRGVGWPYSGWARDASTPAFSAPDAQLDTAEQFAGLKPPTVVCVVDADIERVLRGEATLFPKPKAGSESSGKANAAVSEFFRPTSVPANLGAVRFIRDDPGRQFIGSFRPLESDWMGSALDAVDIAQMRQACVADNVVGLKRLLTALPPHLAARRLAQRDSAARTLLDLCAVYNSVRCARYLIYKHYLGRASHGRTLQDRWANLCEAAARTTNFTAPSLASLAVWHNAVAFLEFLGTVASPFERGTGDLCWVLPNMSGFGTQGDDDDDDDGKDSSDESSTGKAVADLPPASATTSAELADLTAVEPADAGSPNDERAVTLLDHMTATLNELLASGWHPVALAARLGRDDCMAVMMRRGVFSVAAERAGMMQSAFGMRTVPRSVTALGTMVLALMDMRSLVGVELLLRNMGLGQSLATSGASPVTLHINPEPTEFFARVRSFVGHFVCDSGVDESTRQRALAACRELARAEFASVQPGNFLMMLLVTAMELCSLELVEALCAATSDEFVSKLVSKSALYLTAGRCVDAQAMEQTLVDIDDMPVVRDFAVRVPAFVRAVVARLSIDVNEPLLDPATAAAVAHQPMTGWLGAPAARPFSFAPTPSPAFGAATSASAAFGAGAGASVLPGTAGAGMPLGGPTLTPGSSSAAASSGPPPSSAFAGAPPASVSFGASAATFLAPQPSAAPSAGAALGAGASALPAFASAGVPLQASPLAFGSLRAGTNPGTLSSSAGGTPAFAASAPPGAAGAALGPGGAVLALGPLSAAASSGAPPSSAFVGAPPASAPVGASVALPGSAAPIAGAAFGANVSPAAAGAVAPAVPMGFGGGASPAAGTGAGASWWGGAAPFAAGATAQLNFGLGPVYPADVAARLWIGLVSGMLLWKSSNAGMRLTVELRSQTRGLDAPVDDDHWSRLKRGHKLLAESSMRAVLCGLCVYDTVLDMGAKRNDGVTTARVEAVRATDGSPLIERGGQPTMLAAGGFGQPAPAAPPVAHAVHPLCRVLRGLLRVGESDACDAAIDYAAGAGVDVWSALVSPTHVCPTLVDAVAQLCEPSHMARLGDVATFSRMPPPQVFTTAMASATANGDGMLCAFLDAAAQRLFGAPSAAAVSAAPAVAAAASAVSAVPPAAAAAGAAAGASSSAVAAAASTSGSAGDNDDDDSASDDSRAPVVLSGTQLGNSNLTGVFCSLLMSGFKAAPKLAAVVSLSQSPAICVALLSMGELQALDAIFQAVPTAVYVGGGELTTWWSLLGRITNRKRLQAALRVLDGVVKRDAGGQSLAELCVETFTTDAAGRTPWEHFEYCKTAASRADAVQVVNGRLAMAMQGGPGRGWGGGGFGGGGFGGGGFGGGGFGGGVVAAAGANAPAANTWKPKHLKSILSVLVLAAASLDNIGLLEELHALDPNIVHGAPRPTEMVARPGLTAASSATYVYVPPLWSALASGAVKAADWLVQHGALLGEGVPGSDPPFFAEHYSLPGLRWLEARRTLGADVWRSKTSRSVLVHAIAQQHVDAVVWLLERGVPVLGRPGDSDEFAAIWAVVGSRVRLLDDAEQVSLARRVFSVAKARQPQQWPSVLTHANVLRATFAHTAAEESPALLALLAEEGFDLLREDLAGETPIDVWLYGTAPAASRLAGSDAVGLRHASAFKPSAELLAANRVLRAPGVRGRLPLLENATGARGAANVGPRVPTSSLQVAMTRATSSWEDPSGVSINIPAALSNFSVATVQRTWVSL